ncbi:glutaminyl-peptide cyclotransferase [Corynebacterium resistens]
MIICMTAFASRRAPSLTRRRMLPYAGIAIALAGTLLASSACTTDESSEAPNSSTAPGSGGKQSTDPTEPKRLNVQVDKSHPWDKSSFTQGVETDAEGNLVVGTGQYKQSRIYRTTLDGKQSDSHDLPNNFFGEGLTIAGDAVWQLTWKEHTAIKRKSSDLSEIGRARYEGEGWGLCSQKDRLVMSDGTGTLSFRDPATFAKTGEVSVTKAGQATTMLNELECAPDGSVWANVWQTNEIYRIDPQSGKVTGIANLSGKLPAAERSGADVLNGIALIPNDTSGLSNPTGQRFYLTGKWWDELYEVTITE